MLNIEIDFIVNKICIKNKITVEMSISKINYAFLNPHKPLIFRYVK